MPSPKTVDEGNEHRSSRNGNGFADSVFSINNRHAKHTSTYRLMPQTQGFLNIRHTHKDVRVRMLKTRVHTHT